MMLRKVPLAFHIGITVGPFSGRVDIPGDMTLKVIQFRENLVVIMVPIVGNLVLSWDWKMKRSEGVGERERG